MGQSQAAYPPGSSREGLFASLALLMSSQLVVQPPSWLPSPQGSHSLLANLLLTFLLPYLFFFFPHQKKITLSQCCLSLQ